MAQEKKNFFDQFDAPAPQGMQVKAADPLRPGQIAIQGQNITGNDIQNNINGAKVPYAGTVARNEAVTSGQDVVKNAEQVRRGKFGDITGLAKDYSADQRVQAYRKALPMAVTAMSSGDDGRGDLSVVYGWAKAMDPEGSVREGDTDMAKSSSTFIQQIYQKYGQIGEDNRLPKAVRDGLIREMRQKTALLNGGYTEAYNHYSDLARAGGYDPKLVVGNHDGDRFQQIEANYLGRPIRSGDHLVNPDQAAPDAGGLPANPKDGDSYKFGGVEFTYDNGEWLPTIVGGSKGKPPPPEPKGYEASYLSQGLSGVNEGLAGILGAPVDLTTAAINAGASGINALTNSNLPMIENPTLGSQQIGQFLGNIGSIANPTNDTGKQFVRRVGESVGAAAIPGLSTGSLARAGGQFLAGAAGGVGGATAQQAFPGNPLAEMAGEFAAGGAGAVGLAGLRRQAQRRAIEAAVPTTQQLREQAGNLYRQAEQRGVTADGGMTQTLADNMRGVLGREGVISPTGRLSDVHPHVRESMNLLGDYAGQEMSPTQLQTVRSRIADGLASPDRSERRLAGLMTDTFDEWSAPIAPELPQAREVASRYLTAEQLERARELAGARAGQYSGSGFENALRTEYRALDRGAIKGTKRFGGDVTDAIENVSRGTPASNFARGVGKLAPTGVVSFGLGSGLPAMAAGAVGGPLLGGLVGGGMAGAGIVGRSAATQMGIRNADLAELIARNGGRLPEVPLMSPQDTQDSARITLGELMKYLQPSQN